MNGGAITGLWDREGEVQAIATAVKEVVRGAGQALLVEGPAGIGKTRLLEYACEVGRQAGMTVLRARGGEFEGDYPWGVARQLFERAAHTDSFQPGGELGGAAALASPAFGWTSSTGTGEDALFSVLHGLYWLTADISERSPLLLAVDDLHWADGPSLSFVVHLLRRLDGLPVLGVMAARVPRSDRSVNDSLLASAAAEISVRSLRPAPLSESGCASLVGLQLGRQPTAEFVAACRETTGGNPFLLRELVAALVAEGISGGPDDVEHVRRITPGAVSRNVLLRLGRMSPAASAVVRAIAVLGPRATSARVGRLAELDRAAALRAVEALMAERLIEGDNVLEFVHPLVRSVVYQDMPVPIRQDLHERAARLLEDQAARVEEIAAHLLLAGRNGDPWVVDRLRRAATDARERGAPDLAVLYLKRALAEPPQGPGLAELLFELGSVEVGQDPTVAAEHLRQAHAAADDPTTRATIALMLGQALALSGQYAESARLLQSTITELEDPRSPLRSSLQSVLLDTARWDLTTRATSGPILDELATRARGDAGVDPWIHAALATQLTVEATERSAAVDHARRSLQAASQLAAINTPLLSEVITILLFADHHDEASRAGQDLLRSTQAKGWPIASAVAAALASMTALYAGSISDTIAWARQALALSEHAWVAPIAVACMLRAMADRGEFTEARNELLSRGLHQDLEPTWPLNLIRCARASLHTAEGNHDAALTDLLAAGELANQWGIHNPAMLDWRSAAARALVALGRASDARQLSAEELELARRWGAPRAIGIALHAAGIAEGGNRGAVILEEAVEVLRRAPAALELGRTLVELGGMLRRNGSRSQAREALRAGLDLAYQQGATALAERARQELVVAGGRPRREALFGRDALTPAELRVAEMAADGLTNRQIAQALFVTLRAVELHLTNTYAKLAITSRRELSTALQRPESPTRPM